MASKRILKKNVNYLLGDLIEECFIWMYVNPEKDAAAADKIIDEIFDYYNEFLQKVNLRKVENPKQYFASLSSEVEKRAGEIVGKINAL